ncbi:MAG: DTW domain-containing protein [Epsilonproteobacteria bacterium]|nr:DTW domain-containing protein [Campylobacterota bacterium]
MCGYISSFDTNTKFVILMHPKEFKKVKNGTGHLTHLTLKNSELFVGIDFTNHKRINEIIKEYDSFILYPAKDALNLSKQPPKLQKKMAIFIIDATWSCSLKILRDSKNLHTLSSISFDATKLSEFKIKQQPQDFCLSTIESTLCILELLDMYKVEELQKKSLDDFLIPFKEMVKYQQNIITNPLSNAVRFKKRDKI